MYDGTTATFEKISRPDTVEIIGTVGDKIILEEQTQPDRDLCLSLPSGRADQSEDMLAEAKREFLEETGYESDDWLHWKSIYPTGKVIHPWHFYIARDCRLTSVPSLDSGEKITVKLITMDELLTLADEPRFWVGAQFISDLLRLRADERKKEEFRRLIFGGK